MEVASEVVEARHRLCRVGERLTRDTFRTMCQSSRLVSARHEEYLRGIDVQRVLLLLLRRVLLRVGWGWWMSTCLLAARVVVVRSGHVGDLVVLVLIWWEGIRKDWISLCGVSRNNRDERDVSVDTKRTSKKEKMCGGGEKRVEGDRARDVLCLSRTEAIVSRRTGDRPAKCSSLRPAILRTHS